MKNLKIKLLFIFQQNNNSVNCCCYCFKGGRGLRAHRDQARELGRASEVVERRRREPQPDQPRSRQRNSRHKRNSFLRKTKQTTITNNNNK